MSDLNLYAASKQWATRPADERFWTPEEARDACRAYAELAREAELDLSRERLVAVGDDVAVTLDGGRGDELARFTHWSFGQLAKFANAPADYLRKLSPALASECVREGLAAYFDGNAAQVRQALVHPAGTPVLRSLTSQRYTRFWNWKVFDRLADLQGQGWRVPPARPARDGDPRTRPATRADVLRAKSSGGGLSVKAGDLIAPAGIYASDHDMFAFMVNEDARIDDGSDGGLSRGFFVSNSEVGAAALRVTLFHYRHVCSNHIVWGAEDVIDVSVRHVGDVEGRFTLELAGALESYLGQSAKDEQARVKRARKTILGKTDEDVLDAVFKAFTKTRKYNLPSGLSVKVLSQAIEAAKANEDTDGNPYSVWGVVNGLTRVSQITAYTDERTFLDRAASAILQLAV